MEVYLYKLENCDGCKAAHRILKEDGYSVREYLIDNPLLEIGNKLFFKDGLVHAPLIIIPNKGAYILTSSEPYQLLRICNFESKMAYDLETQ